MKKRDLLSILRRYNMSADSCVQTCLNLCKAGCSAMFAELISSSKINKEYIAFWPVGFPCRLALMPLDGLVHSFCRERNEGDNPISWRVSL
jgi:hypothetical protein